MTPELVEKAKALSPEIKQFLFKIALKHTRHSDTLTLRQVMQEILADYQAVGAAIATDNGDLAADAARRVANHRLPRGGMLPYLPLEKVNDQGPRVLPAMEEHRRGRRHAAGRGRREGRHGRGRRGSSATSPPAASPATPTSAASRALRRG